MGMGGHENTEENTPFNLNSLLRGGGEYYLGQKNIDAVQLLGQETQEGANLSSTSTRRSCL